MTLHLRLIPFVLILIATHVLGAKAQDVSADAVAPPQDPLVAALLEDEPNTPADIVRCIETLLNLGHPEVARTYVKKLIESKPDDATMAQLVRDVGSSLLVRIGQTSSLRPDGAQLSDAVLAGTRRYTQDPARLQQFADQLSDPLPRVRYAAIRMLREAPEAATAPLVNLLADESRAEQHARIRAALISLGPATIVPLAAALDAPSTNLKVQVIVVLAQIGDRRAVKYLATQVLSGQAATVQGAALKAVKQIVGREPSASEIERLLYTAARQSMKRQITLGSAPVVRVWQWKNGRLGSLDLPVSAYASWKAAGLAHSLHLSQPRNDDYRRLYLAAQLTTAKLLGGLDQPLPLEADSMGATAMKLGMGAIEDSLGDCLRSEHHAAAIAATEILGVQGSEETLRSSGSEKRPLVQALKSDNRRVRFAAVAAIMNIDPKTAYAGSSHLPTTLAHFIAGAGVRRALVAHPKSEKAQQLAGQLGELGYEVDKVSNGRDALLFLASTDYDILFVSEAMDRPAQGELIQLVRQAERSRSIPIGLVAEGHITLALQQQSDRDSLTMIFPRSANPDIMARQLARLLATKGEDLQSAGKKQQQAILAIDWYSKLAANADRSRIYELNAHHSVIEQALGSPILSRSAAQALAHLDVPSAQRALVAAASRNLLSLPQRQAAAAAFDVAVRRRGVLLTTREIMTQYDRYNASENLDRSTQQVLSSLLDSIESANSDNNTDSAPDTAGVSIR